MRRDDLVRAAGNDAGSRAERLGRVEREIRQAQAEALGRAGERLQKLLGRLAVVDEEVDALVAGRPAGRSAPGALRARIDVRNRLCAEALRARQELVIQREALGFARHTLVEQCYPVPGVRRWPDLHDPPRRQS
jgi:hypothetical protein